MSIEDVSSHAVQEILADIKGPIAVYGHCAGNAIAIAITRKLEQAGADVVALVIGGMLTDADPEQVLGNVEQQSGQDIIAFLRSIGGFKDVLDEDTLAKISRMTKHDSIETATFFAADAVERKRIKAPIHVIVGDQDPLTPDYRSRYLDWQSYADQVSLSVIEGGGHYFVTDHPVQLAQVLEKKFHSLTQAGKKRGPRTLREFHNPFDDSNAVFHLLKNSLGQYSLWPVFAPLPDGWKTEFGPASHDICMDFLLKPAVAGQRPILECVS